MSVALLVSAMSACDAGPSEPAADVVLLGGKIRTPSGWQEALAVSGREIAVVGSSAEVRALVDEHTQVVDLSGRVVLPGLYDMHVHPIYGGAMYSGADYTNCLISQGAELDALLEAVRLCIERVPPGSWVTGGQWDASALQATPHRSQLDAVSGETPVILNDTSGHSVWVNSRALQLAGVAREMPDPSGGIIERDEAGVPTGVLREIGS